MIIVRTVRVAVPGGRDAWPEGSSFGRLHAVASAVMEGPKARPRGVAHDAQDKPWAVRPHRWDGDAELVLRAAWFASSAAPPAVPDQVRLGKQLHPVLPGGALDEPVDYAELVRHPAYRAVTLQALSPTFFEHGRHDLVLPDPQLVVRDLADRWALWAPAGFHFEPAVVAATIAGVYLVDFELYWATVDIGHRGADGRAEHRSGFVGAFRLALSKKEPSPCRQVLTTLALFSEYTGLGSHTTHGCGSMTIDRAGWA